jgi:hypothetical protein
MKTLLLAAVLAAATITSQAQIVAPAGADLPARIMNLGPRTVVVEVVKPKAVDTVWDEIATSLAGCRIEGSRSASRAGHMVLEFATLKCTGKPAVALQGIGVSSVTQRVDLNSDAGVGTRLAVLVLSDVSLPGGKLWTTAIK